MSDGRPATAPGTVKVLHGRGHKTPTILPSAESGESPSILRLLYHIAGTSLTISQAVRAFGLLQAHSGPGKLQLQHVVTAVAINPVRLDTWLAGRPLPCRHHAAGRHRSPES